MCIGSVEKNIATIVSDSNRLTQLHGYNQNVGQGGKWIRRLGKETMRQ